MIRDSAGNLYGTTAVVAAHSAMARRGVQAGSGRQHDGAVQLHGRGRWGQPFAGVIRDSAGNLYGTTFFGGTADAGVVYKLDPAGNETVLYSFTGGVDGANPYSGVIRGPKGRLFGPLTTAAQTIVAWSSSSNRSKASRLPLARCCRLLGRSGSANASPRNCRVRDHAADRKPRLSMHWAVYNSYRACSLYIAAVKRQLR